MYTSSKIKDIRSLIVTGLLIVSGTVNTATPSNPVIEKE